MTRWRMVVVSLAGLGALLAAWLTPDCAHLAAGSTADDLRRIAAARGATFQPRDCAAVRQSRVVVCSVRLSATQLHALRVALAMAPYGTIQAPGPAFGVSRCFQRMGPRSVALVTAFPWSQPSHYRYLLVVAPEDGGDACIETEHGYG